DERAVEDSVWEREEEAPGRRVQAGEPRSVHQRGAEGGGLARKRLGRLAELGGEHRVHHAERVPAEGLRRQRRLLCGVDGYDDDAHPGRAPRAFEDETGLANLAWTQNRQPRRSASLELAYQL